MAIGSEHLKVLSCQRSKILCKWKRLSRESSDWKERKWWSHLTVRFLNILKVSKVQNEFMMSPFLPKYEPNTVPHYRAEILTIFGSYFGRNDDFINSYWNLLTFKYIEATKFSTLIHLVIIDLLTVHK